MREREREKAQASGLAAVAACNINTTGCLAGFHLFTIGVCAFMCVLSTQQAFSHIEHCDDL